MLLWKLGGLQYHTDEGDRADMAVDAGLPPLTRAAAQTEAHCPHELRARRTPGGLPLV